MTYISIVSLLGRLLAETGLDVIAFNNPGFYNYYLPVIASSDITIGNEE